MQKKHILLMTTLLIGFAGMAANSQMLALSWPFSAPVVEQESSVVDPQQGNIMFDHTSGTDGDFKGYNGNTWVNFGAAAGAGVPAGSILPFAGTSAPAGYLMADGSTVSRTTYADLFAAVGTAFGSGDGSTTFTLPDLRGRFLRGVDDGAARDPNAATRTAMATGGNTGDNVGSVQADAFQGHWHALTFLNNQGYAVGNADDFTNTPNTTVNNSVRDPVTDGTNGTPRVASETRPINAYVNYIIKY